MAKRKLTEYNKKMKVCMRNAKGLSRKEIKEKFKHCAKRSKGAKK